MQMDSLSVMPHNNAKTLLAISLVMLAVLQHYYVSDNVHVERRYLQLQVVTVGGERSRLSGLVNCSLVTDYTLRYCSSAQVDR
jgi:hypothetical protein